MSLRVLFMGTPDFAVPTLAEIVDRGHQVVAVYARAPKPAGRRGLELTPSPVERHARRLGLTILTPTTLRSTEAETVARAHGADVAVVVAYGLILPRCILDACPMGAFNLHASLLPRWRGAAPIARAIMAGDTESGVMVMRMEEGLDTGPIASTARVPIGPDDTTGDLHDRLARIGAGLMGDALAALEDGTLTLTSQATEGATYAGKIGKEETRIQWARPWREVHDHIRGLSPHPGAWFQIAGEGARIKVLRSTAGEGAGAPGTVLDERLTVACAGGAVRIVDLQRAGRQPMPAADFLRGTALPAGTRLS